MGCLRFMRYVYARSLRQSYVHIAPTLLTLDSNQEPSGSEPDATTNCASKHQCSLVTLPGLDSNQRHPS